MFKTDLRCHGQTAHMATVQREIRIGVPPGRVWALISDFHHAPVRMAPGFVVDSVPDGPDVRVVTFASGAVARERFVACDEESRRAVFSIIGGTVMPIHDSSSMQVLDDGAGGCRFVWIHDVLPDDIAPRLGAAMDQGLAVLKRIAEHAHEQDAATH
jgi:Polyketide cyclase / dehydrase and lipid transport